MKHCLITLYNLFVVAFLMLSLSSCGDGVSERLNGRTSTPLPVFCHPFIWTDISIISLVTTGQYDTNSDFVRDTILCSFEAEELYSLMGVYFMSEQSFLKNIQAHCEQNKPISVSPEVFEYLKQNEIHENKQIMGYYEEHGANGMIELLSVRKIEDWMHEDPDNLFYILSLLWNHNVYLEVSAAIDPYVYFIIEGDKQLTKTYYDKVGEPELHSLVVTE